MPAASGLEEVQNTCLRSSEIADQFVLRIVGSEFVAAAVSTHKYCCCHYRGPSGELQHWDPAHLTVKLNQLFSITFGNIRKNKYDKQKIFLMCVHYIE